MVYDGQYDVQFPVDSDEANEDNKITLFSLLGRKDLMAESM